MIPIFYHSRHSPEKNRAPASSIPEYRWSLPLRSSGTATPAPIRYLAEYFGYIVGWDAVAREAVFTGGGKTIYFPIDSSTARTSDGGTVTMDTAAVIVNDRTYAPIRYLAEYFGYSVDWNAEARAVIITG